MWLNEEHIQAEHPLAGVYNLYLQGDGEPLFTENETNNERLFRGENRTQFVKDGFHRFVVNGESEAVNSALAGTKAAFHLHKTISAGESFTCCARLTPEFNEDPFVDFEQREMLWMWPMRVLSEPSQVTRLHIQY